MRNVLAAIALVAMSSNVIAADVSGVYSTHKDGCAWRKNQDVYPKDFESITYLTKDGVMGWEWGCDFLSSQKSAHGETVYIASCAMEGNTWPDLVLVEDSAQGYRASVKGADPMEFPYKCE